MVSFASYYLRLNKQPYDTNGENNQLEFQHHICGGQLATDSITRLKDSHSFIIAPYFDNRNGSFIRVISIIHHQKVKELYCMFCCKNDSNRIMVKARIDVHSDRFEFPYGTTDLVCLEPQDCSPQYMFIHPTQELNPAQLPVFKIKNRNSGHSLLDFTVCISTMYGNYNNILQFVQSIEMYKILGAQRVVIYKNNCSQLMEKILDYYISEGTVEIRAWPIHLYLNVSSHWHHSHEGKDLGYFGQITALNDCIYHNMYKSKYVLLNDVDEIILPVKEADWKSMMQRLEMQHPGAGVFLFENHDFPVNVFAPTVEGFNFSTWNPVPGVNILEHISREPNKKGAFNNRKMMVNPRKVIQTSVHSVLKMYGNHVNVPSDVAINFHCRKSRREDLPEGSLIRDPTLWQYNRTLIANVNQVLHKAKILKTDTQL
ncbi:uncharacterized protein [Tiliqua scincoides]|uniref:uncharacterized protein n=1 Tax=Tiliqua scincoides TaxID=71010 RepID=UPI0034626973